MTKSSFFPQRPGWQQWRWISSSKLVCLGYEEEGNDVSGTAMFQICRKPEIPTCFESPDDVCDDHDGDDGVGDDGSNQLESVGITSLLASSWPTHHAWLLTKLMNNVHWLSQISFIFAVAINNQDSWHSSAWSWAQVTGQWHSKIFSAARRSKYFQKIFKIFLLLETFKTDQFSIQEHLWNNLHTKVWFQVEGLAFSAAQLPDRCLDKPCLEESLKTGFFWQIPLQIARAGTNPSITLDW